MTMVKNCIVNVVAEALWTRVTLDIIIVKKVMFGVGGKEEKIEHQNIPKISLFLPKLKDFDMYKKYIFYK